MRVALIGLRGAGKTTVGRALANLSGVDYYDSDALVAELSGRTPDEWILRGEERVFRDWERRAVSQIATRPVAVFALGGGGAMQPEVREALRDWSVVLLDAPDATLVERIESDRAGRDQTGSGTHRPALTDLPLSEEIAELRVRRFTVYRKFATFAIDTAERSPSQIAAEIERRLLHS